MKVILYLGFAAFIILAFVGSWKFFEKQAEDDVSDGHYSEFPVVVVKRAEAAIVLIKPDGTYHGKADGDSFAVPAGKEQLVEDWLRAEQEKDGSKGARQLRVAPIGEGRQLVELEIFGDGLFLSRYEATDKEVKPLLLRLSGPLFVLYPCAATVVFGTLMFGLLQFVLWYTRRLSGPV